MMEKNIDKKNIATEFSNMLIDAKKHPAKYNGVKECKNLSEIYSFIKNIHPEYTFTEKDLGNFILCCAKVPDDQLNVSGGVYMTSKKRKAKEEEEKKKKEEEEEEITEHWLVPKLKKASYWTKFGSKMVDMFGTMLFSPEEMDPMALPQQIADLMQYGVNENEAYTSDAMLSIDSSINNLKHIKNNIGSNLIDINGAIGNE